MKDADRNPVAIRLEDYQPSAFLIDEVVLEFDLEANATTVKSKMQFRRNSQAASEQSSLRLDGENLELLQVLLDDQPLKQGTHYTLDDSGMEIFGVPESFSLAVHTKINPAENTTLEGLYVSSGNFCTQCEAEGFRRITYYLDRPDVLAKFTTLIRADAKRYPVLLSNGNRVDFGTLSDGRHWVQWQDPYPKPCYLFALVAGDLQVIKESYRTQSGRDVALEIYVQSHNKDKCQHAMRSLINAMRWDEQVFNLEYDLDSYMIVAVDDFNMGAMENKGLNLFNSKYVLAKPDTATDVDYLNIEGVIGHEYFHNWTGNRVTCRDWFQLSLKEGLTVFRDQEFSSDMSARAIKRIQDVQLLRTVQFAEDAGPMAHPVRPDSYIEVNNFYTVTVYEKGAEVIRMQHTLLGAEGFQKGIALYFKRHDGQAVTIEDFVSAMEDANDVELKQFRLWYHQAGTPLVSVSSEYNSDTKQYSLSVEQSPAAAEHSCMHIPLAVGLLDKRGQEMRLNTSNGESSDDTLVLNIKQKKQTFVFNGVVQEPVPSLLRGFSAPVKLQYDYSDADLELLMKHDSDSFVQWEACQRYAQRVIECCLQDSSDYKQKASQFVDAFSVLLQDDKQELALLAQALMLPSEKYLAEQFTPQDPIAIFDAREKLSLLIAEHCYDLLRLRYNELQDASDYSLQPEAIGRRALKNLCLSYLMQTGKADAVELTVLQYRQSNNMTDREAALRLLTDRGGGLAQDVLNDFYQRFKSDSLVLDKWFGLQAGSKRKDALQVVEKLVLHPDFSLSNPNKVRSVIGAFCLGNPVRFHCTSGAGYEFLTKHVLQLDQRNPQVAARMVSAFNNWSKLVQPQQDLMHEQLEYIGAQPNLSKDVYEIINKALKVNR